MADDDTKEGDFDKAGTPDDKKEQDVWKLRFWKALEQAEADREKEREEK